jgi:hypothetical protein
MEEKRAPLNKVAKPSVWPALVIVIIIVLIAVFFVAFNHFYKVI